MKKLLILFAAVIAAGCASTAQTTSVYHDAQGETPKSGDSRLTLFRPAEGKAMSKADAHVEIDGASVKPIAYGAFTSVDLPSGVHKISVKAFGTSTCNLSASTSSEEEAFFEIVPRERANSAWSVFGAAGAIAGSAVEGAGKECAGEFAVRKVDASYAKEKLSAIHQNSK